MIRRVLTLYLFQQKRIGIVRLFVLAASQIESDLEPYIMVPRFGLDTYFPPDKDLFASIIYDGTSLADKG
ncbi:hypothetical protein [Photorhabdus australis]|uniref:hypothetical protein n=1 Tax=Photorhabdus australis TaxID=286156 RepID=UPI0013F4DD49|nr:hypothetical protein [Photorhabdus australis]